MKKSSAKNWREEQRQNSYAQPKPEWRVRERNSYSFFELAALGLIPIGGISWWLANDRRDVDLTPRPAIHEKLVFQKTAEKLKPEPRTTSLPLSAPIRDTKPLILEKFPLAEVKKSEAVPSAEAEVNSELEKLAKFDELSNLRISIEKELSLTSQKVEAGNEHYRGAVTKQRWTYAFQEGNRVTNEVSRNPANATGGEPSVSAPKVALTCSAKPPMSKDPSCRADYPCRICGGCCCFVEAHLAFGMPYPFQR